MEPRRARGARKTNLDMRARGAERERARSEQHAAQERAPIARRCGGPRPGAQRRAVERHDEVVPRAGTCPRAPPPAAARTAMRRASGASWTAVRAVAWSSVRNAVPRAAAVQQADQLGAAAARARRLDAGELALDLAGEQHRARQEASPRAVGPAAAADASSAVLLLEPHDSRRELGGIVPVRVGGVDDVLLDDRPPAAPPAGGHRPRPAARSQPAGRRASVVAVDDHVVDEVVADVGEERRAGAGTRTCRASRQAASPRCRRTPSGPARPPARRGRR